MKEMQGSVALKPGEACIHALHSQCFLDCHSNFFFLLLKGTVQRSVTTLQGVCAGHGHATSEVA